MFAAFYSICSVDCVVVVQQSDAICALATLYQNSFANYNILMYRMHIYMFYKMSSLQIYPTQATNKQDVDDNEPIIGCLRVTAFRVSVRDEQLETTQHPQSFPVTWLAEEGDRRLNGWPRVDGGEEGCVEFGVGTNKETERQKRLTRRKGSYIQRIQLTR